MWGLYKSKQKMGLERNWFVWLTLYTVSIINVSVCEWEGKVKLHIGTNINQEGVFRDRMIERLLFSVHQSCSVHLPTHLSVRFSLYPLCIFNISALCIGMLQFVRLTYKTTAKVTPSSLQNRRPVRKYVDCKVREGPSITVFGSPLVETNQNVTGRTPFCSNVKKHTTNINLSSKV